MTLAAGMRQFEGATTVVRYREWLVPNPRASAVLVHGVGEHSGLYERFAAGLNSAEVSLRALDLIGHGHTPGPRGVISSAGDLAFDVRHLTGIAADADAGTPVFLIGHSLGGIVAALSAGRGSGPLAGLVLSGTTLSAPPLADSAAFADAEDAEFRLAADSLSADPAYLAQLANDPLVFTGGAVIADSLRRILPPAWAELSSTLPDLDLPVLMVHGEQDAVSPQEIVRAWVVKLKRARLVTFPGARHDVLNDTVHQAVTTVIADFITTTASNRFPPPC